MLANSYPLCRLARHISISVTAVLQYRVAEDPALLQLAAGSSALPTL
jgi:hypothetical protein